MSFQEEIAAATVAAGNALERARMLLDNEIKASEDGHEVVRAAEAYVDFREAFEALSDQFNRLKTEYTRVSEARIPDMLEASSLRNVPLESRGRRVEVRIRSWTSIRTGKKDEAFCYLRGAGAEGLIQDHVNTQTLSSYANSVMDEGLELPQDIFNTYEKRALAWPKLAMRK